MSFRVTAIVKTASCRLAVLALSLSFGTTPVFAGESAGFSLEAIPPRAKALHRCKPGPWGDLEYFPMMLEAPERVQRAWRVPESRTTWHFPGMTRESVWKIFESLRAPRELLEELRAGDCWEEADGNTTVFPPDRVVSDLPREARGRLYSYLGQWTENRLHRTPAFIYEDDVRAWFSGSGLSEELVSEIEQLTYRRGKCLAFCDVSYLLRGVRDERARARLAGRIVSRTRTLVLRMRLSPGSDLEELEAYWGGDGGSGTSPVMRSVALTEGVGVLDFAHLLPPGPRELLYTYPLPEDPGILASLDCHWTAANFFRPVSTERLLDSKVVTAFLENNYDPVMAPYRYGDVLRLIEPTSGGFTRGVHSCIFIADDIVFTKNGRGMGRPWILMKLDDVLARYPTTGLVQGFRKRDAGGPTVRR